MANKQYISIIRLLKHCGIGCDGELNVPRIKKQLNAEFGYSANGFIEVDGYTYNKNDVLEELELPNFYTRLHYHKKIWANKNILAILEDNVVNLQDVKDAFDEFQHDVAFDEFFSPYFAAPFNHICRSYINERDLYDVGKWLRFEGFLLGKEREEGFKAIRIFLEETLRLFRNINSDNYKSFRPKIMPWITPGWENFLNNLPDECYSLKDKVVIDLINLTVAIQKTDTNDARNISSGLMIVSGLPENLRNTIYGNDAAYNKNAKPSNYGWVVGVGVVVLKLLVFSGSCR